MVPDMGLIKESEIFNEYVKLAEKEGLVNESDYGNVKIAADEASAIEALYGLQLNDEPKNPNYSPLLDKAHPETAVAGIANDRMNGVVEDLKQRQSIMTGIALKTPDGALIQRRYVKAYNDLMNTLVRVGFTMDHEDYPDLMKTADTCAGELEKRAEILKEAQWVAAAWLIGSVLAAAYAINHTPASRQNVMQNCQLVLDAVASLPHSSVHDDIVEKVGNLKSLAATVQPIRSDLGSAESVIQASKTHKEDFDRLQKYIAALSAVEERIPRWLNTVQKEPDYEEASSDWWEKIKDVVHEFTGSAKTDIVTDLEGLFNTIQTERKSLDTIINNVKSDIVPKAQSALQTDPAFRQQVMSNMSGGNNEEESTISVAPTNISPATDVDKTQQSLMGWE